MQPKLRCTLKIWIKETLPLPKDRGIITKNIISLKYQKLAIAVSLNGKDGLMLLPTTLKKLWIYKVNRNTSLIGNIVPDREFHWSSDHEFYTRLRIWNWKSVWSTAISIRKPMLLCKNESFLKRKQFHWRIFFQVSQNPVRQRKVYKMMAVIQNSAIKYYHAFHVRSHKNSEM